MSVATSIVEHAVQSGAMKTSDGGSIKTALWAIFALLASGSMASLGWWVKGLPERRRARTEAEKVEIDSEARIRSEMWKDIEALKVSKEETSRRLTLAETQIVGQTIRLGQQAFVINMLLDEIDRLSPQGNAVARSARAVLTVQNDAMPQPEEVGPIAEIMSKMCKIAEGD